MVSNKAASFTFIAFLCASAASAKFSFSREQLRQFDIRRRHTTVGPSNAFRPAAAVSTVTVTVSTTSTTTSTATTTSTTTSQTTASTTITDTITTSAVPDPAVVQMHTTHIAILPRETNVFHEKLRMRKIRRSAIFSRHDADADDDTLGDVTIAMPPSENIATMKQVHRQRVAHTDTHSPSGISAIGTRSIPVNDVEAVPVDTLTGAVGIGKSMSTTTSGTEGNVNAELDSAREGIVYVAESDVTTTSSDAVNTEARPVLAGANGASPSAVESVVKTASSETSTGTDAGTSNRTNSSDSSDSLSVGVLPYVELDLL